VTAVRIVHGAEAVRRELLARSAGDLAPVSEASLAVAGRLYGAPLSAREAVARIVADVAREGDAAVRRIAQAVGDPVPARFEVRAAERDEARQRAPAALLDDLRFAAERIERFHRQQRPQDFMDPAEGVGQRWIPVDRAGIYVPGGETPLASSVLMAAIPARVAGVAEIVLCTPLGPHGLDPAVAAAAAVAGVTRVFGIGGAQAIAAMAYGTASVPRCDVVAGPGSAWILLAKREVYGIVGVDLLPGPTETLVIADASADPEEAAADLLAQAEHGGPASPIALTDRAAQARAIAGAVERQMATLPRRTVAEHSFAQRGGIGVVATLGEAVQLANAYAPEHLCLLVRDPDALLPLVRHAGGVFFGRASPEVLGDYVAGPSHIMPTGGTARFSSPGGVYAYLKAVSVVRLPANRVAGLAASAARLARAEGLEGHARAAERRLRA